MKLFNKKSIQFGQILQEIKNYLSKTIGGTTDIDQSTVFGQLLTVITSVTSNLMIYIEDAFTEQNKYTAQRRKSIYGLAAQSGYEPSMGTAAGAWVRLSHIPNSNAATTLLIQDKTKLVCSQNGLYYCLDLGVPVITLETGSSSHNTYYYVVQGQYESQRYVSTGDPGFVASLKFIGFIDLTHLTVLVDGVPYKRAASLYDMGAFEHKFYLRYNVTGGIDVIFGNDIHGKKLNEGSVVDVSYLLHDGESGTITPDNNVRFVFSDSIKNVGGEEVDGNVMLEISLADRHSIVAGSDAEDVKQVARMIGYNSRSLVLSDANSYAAFLNRYSMVGYNRTWSEPGSMIVKSMVLKNFKLRMASSDDYFKLKQEDFLLSVQQKESILNAVKQSGQQLAGTIYEISDLNLWRYSLYISIRPKTKGIDRASTSALIRRAVGELFANLGDDRYIPKSDIIKIIKDQVPGVDGVDVMFLSERNETALNRGFYEEDGRKIKVYANENPNLGLDEYGNISLSDLNDFPVLMGDWSWLNRDGDTVTAEPIVITYRS